MSAGQDPAIRGERHSEVVDVDLVFSFVTFLHGLDDKKEEVEAEEERGSVCDWIFIDKRGC